jgi:predicted metalloenzyme YecM
LENKFKARVGLNLEHFLLEGVGFVKAQLSQLKADFIALGIENLELEKLEFDHLCYRVETLERYDEIKSSLSKIATMFHETLVNGRLIALFELSTPIEVTPGVVLSILELPAPKLGAHYSEGFEHTEWVAPFEKTVKLSLGVVKFHRKSLMQTVAEEKALLSAH